MRRFLYWHLPITGALIAVAIFAWGFAGYLRGETGTPVDFLPAATATTAAAPRRQLAPLILGDSLARGAGDQEGLGIAGRLDSELKKKGVQARRTYNVAVNGARTPDLLEVLKRPNVRLMLREANVIIVSIGGNDLWGGNDWRNAAPPDPDAAMDDVLTRIEAAIASIREANPNARIFFVGLYNPFAATEFGRQLAPMVTRWNSRLAERFSSDPNFTLVQTEDLFSHNDRLALDRFHPGGEAYGIIARRIAEAL